MAKVNVDCPECGDRQQFEEAHLGSEMVCPKCRTRFVSERAENYDLADEPAEPRRASEETVDPPSRGGDSAQAAPSRKPAKPGVEPKRDPKLIDRLERWAEDEE